jgi:hypothetical protein
MVKITWRELHKRNLARREAMGPLELWGEDRANLVAVFGEAGLRPRSKLEQERVDDRVPISQRKIGHMVYTPDERRYYEDRAWRKLRGTTK